ncbi:hypothetical protein KIN20_004025 [Parelaphostrongylus tenuis]|uniref:Uncharacterized protein n=1 Tax=Parelaphostrongylus tenuis TaxID=148309 RepID=A0AAD5QET9_PARTN|nr:hypothetical protein KIN20_004025 [Parelaphostrongylus tenuis]
MATVGDLQEPLHSLRICSDDGDLSESADDIEDMDLAVVAFNSQESDSDDEAIGTSSGTSAVRCCSSTVITPTLLPFDENLGGVQSGAFSSCRIPVDFYEVFMKDIWKLIKEQTNV